MNPPRGWEPGDRFPARKLPPPEHGIKIKQAGSSWWGKRWLDALESALGADAGRLARGRSYARAGRTHDLVVVDGKVRAQVTGSRATPYEVNIELEVLSEQTWQSIIAAMVEKAQFAAELLAGEMPRDLEQLFQTAGTSLFPVSRQDLKTSCSCPDWGDPCKHVAATHYVLGEALDRDPFLLLELRGRSKERVLAALQSARRSPEPPATKRRKSRPRPARAPAADYDKPRAALPELDFSFDPPEAHGAVLRQLGTPGGWKAQQSPADALTAVLRAAAEHARSLALGSEADRSEPAEPTDDDER